MGRVLLAGLLFVLPGLCLASYKFTIANNTANEIVGIEVSEDGESWGEFDVGAGVPAGQSAEATWDESTDESNCEWMFRATFADGTVSEEVAFDFCEEDLTIEFD